MLRFEQTAGLKPVETGSVSWNSDTELHVRNYLLMGNCWGEPAGSVWVKPPVLSETTHLFEKSDMEDTQPLTEVKVLFLGDEGVGKTTIVKTFAEGSVQHPVPHTAEMSYIFKIVKLRNREVIFKIWDSPGKIEKVNGSYFHDVMAIAIVVRGDLSPLQSLQKWKNIIKHHSEENQAEIYIVLTTANQGNASNLKDLENFAATNYYHIIQLSDDSVQSMFCEIAFQSLPTLRQKSARK